MTRRSRYSVGVIPVQRTNARETADRIEDSITKRQRGVNISTRVGASLGEAIEEMDSHIGGGTVPRP